MHEKFTIQVTAAKETTSRLPMNGCMLHKACSIIIKKMLMVMNSGSTVCRVKILDLVSCSQKKNMTVPKRRPRRKCGL